MFNRVAGALGQVLAMVPRGKAMETAQQTSEAQCSRPPASPLMSSRRTRLRRTQVSEIWGVRGGREARGSHHSEDGAGARCDPGRLEAAT